MLTKQNIICVCIRHFVGLSNFVFLLKTIRTIGRKNYCVFPGFFSCSSVSFFRVFFRAVFDSQQN